jgi:hypothetical protein
MCVCVCVCVYYLLSYRVIIFYRPFCPHYITIHYSSCCRISRPLSSNQRMQFALDPFGHALATGSEDGRLLVFDTHTFEQVHEEQVSNNCLNCVSFHPYAAMLVATSGQRNFELSADVDKMDGDDNDDNDDSGSGNEGCISSGVNNNNSSNPMNSVNSNSSRDASSPSNINNNSSNGSRKSGSSPAFTGVGVEKWSELQVYGLHKNETILKQLYAAYSPIPAVPDE